MNHSRTRFQTALNTESGRRYRGDVTLLSNELSSADLTLRRWRPEMVDAMRSAVELSFGELRRWMPWAQSLASREELVQVLKDGEGHFDADREWNYALYEKSSGELVGSAGLSRQDDPHFPEIGYWVRSDRTGRGYASQAARVLCVAAFDALADASRVKIRMDQANGASAAIPPKIGFRLLEEEDRAVEAEGHTGKGFVWIVERTTPPDLHR